MRYLIHILARFAEKFVQKCLDGKTYGKGFMELFLKSGLFLTISGIIFLISITDMRQVSNLKNYSPSMPSVLLDRKGRVITSFFQDHRILIEKQNIPDHLIQAFLSMEDNHFYSHHGVSPQAILRAFLVNLQAGGVKQGGSTITQQLAKVILTNQKRTLTRKIKEASLSLLVEFLYSKEEILQMYFNQIYFGHGNYGAEAASLFYFGKHAKDLRQFESAILSTLPSAPNKYSPVKNPHLARQRMAHALMKMTDQGYLTRERATEEYTAGLTYLSELNISPSETAFGRRLDNAPYYSEYMRQILEKEVGKTQLYSGGLRIHTGLDIDHQRVAQKSLWEGLERQNKISRNYRFTKQLEMAKAYAPVMKLLQIAFDMPQLSPERSYAQFEMSLYFYEQLADSIELVNLGLGGEDGLDGLLLAARQANPFLNRYMTVQGAFAEIDNITGEVTAVVGGAPFTSQNQVNRALQVSRQPGSTFKPLLYAAAIESKKATAASLFADSPIVFLDQHGDTWMPENYSGGYRGFITLRDALRYSINSVSVALAREAGLHVLLPIISRELHVKPQAIPHNLSVALGTYEVSPLQLSRAFSLFPRGGMEIEPVFLKKITDSKGNIIKEYKYTMNEKPDQILSSGTASIMTSLLETAVNQGTGSSVRKAGFKGYAGGKTGTSNNFRDVWFVGFNKRYTSAVWVGYDRPTMSLGAGQAGAGVAAPIWSYYQQRVSKYIKDEESQIARGGAKSVTVCKSTGKLPGLNCPDTTQELFLPGTEPVTAEEDAEMVPVAENAADYNRKKPVIKSEDFFGGDEN